MEIVIFWVRNVRKLGSLALLLRATKLFAIEVGGGRGREVLSDCRVKTTVDLPVYCFTRM